ncbi:MAG: hypothetical protein DBX59_00385 [Bacillota bacterium]|nr:MAG: hypothetical protein DBX59_00385 [Bacillota bacterium]
MLEAIFSKIASFFILFYSFGKEYFFERIKCLLLEPFAKADFINLLIKKNSENRFADYIIATFIPIVNTFWKFFFTITVLHPGCACTSLASKTKFPQ